MAKLGAFDYETRDDMREQLGATVERFAQPFIDRLNAAYSTSDLETARSLTMADALSLQSMRNMSGRLRPSAPQLSLI